MPYAFRSIYPAKPFRSRFSLRHHKRHGCKSFRTLLNYYLFEPQKPKTTPTCIIPHPIYQLNNIESTEGDKGIPDIVSISDVVMVCSVATTLEIRHWKKKTAPLRIHSFTKWYLRAWHKPPFFLLLEQSLEEGTTGTMASTWLL